MKNTLFPNSTQTSVSVASNQHANNNNGPIKLLPTPILPTTTSSIDKSSTSSSSSLTSNKTDVEKGKTKQKNTDDDGEDKDSDENNDNNGDNDNENENDGNDDNDGDDGDDDDANVPSKSLAESMVAEEEPDASEMAHAACMTRGRFPAGESYDVNMSNLIVSQGAKDLLVGASLKLLRNHRYGIIGRNGVGKSTLLKRITMHKIVGKCFVCIRTRNIYKLLALSVIFLYFFFFVLYIYFVFYLIFLFFFLKKRIPKTLENLLCQWRSTSIKINLFGICFSC